MADVPEAVHAHILRTIREARAGVVALRKSAQVMEGYLGFDHADKTLADCHAAISGERDHARVVTVLRYTVRTLELLGGGAVSPVVESTRNTFKTIVNELEPPKETPKE